jgi:hypothetical protein
LLACRPRSRDLRKKLLAARTRQWTRRCPATPRVSDSLRFARFEMSIRVQCRTEQILRSAHKHFVGMKNIDEHGSNVLIPHTARCVPL